MFRCLEVVTEAKPRYYSLCEEVGNTCEYREVEPPRNASVPLDQLNGILDRIEALERRAGGSTIADQTDPSRQHPDSAEFILGEDFGLGSAETPDVAPSLAPTPLNSAGLNTTMAIPLSHSTTTGSLLRSAPAQALLGDYPQDIFLHVELGRSVSASLSLTPKPLSQVEIPIISRNEADELVHKFFNLVHRFYPILDEDEFRRTYDDAFTQGLAPNLATSMVLIVLALGSVSDAECDGSSTSWEPGSRFSSPAVSILLTVGLESFGGSLLLPQSLYLAAIYYSFLARPLPAWRLVHMASTEVQHYWVRKLGSLNDAHAAVQDQLILRLCWATFILECDIVAEHHFPRSGIDNVVEQLPFPGFGNSPEPPMLRWLANISSRRLLNRIHYVLYDTYQGATASMDSSSGAPASQFGISQELNRQLHAWYDLLPPTIKPDLDHDEHGLDDAILLMRFHAAGDIIHRPFLLQVCALPSGETSPDARMVENAKTCLYHCRGYLGAVQGVLRKPSASLEIFTHS
ncbi:hypothetical protein BHE90_003521 [Fusarium euwallaceae]|uniref:Transcription factor domain-containing protein n=1 Tax=Fusarium euwallaceae TaxID=1147111 RepID=A0A430M221_9HYPO|nr:hypothetical protein BHE90_003521 [Fusarium euwallaceae]